MPPTARNLLAPSQVKILQAGIDANLADPSSNAKTASRADDPGQFIVDFCNWHRNPQYREVIFHSCVPAVAAELMGSRTARFHHDHMLTKESGARQSTPWHQDQPYYDIEGRQNVSFWIPVDPVSRGATLEFVAGSHLGPWLMPRSFMNTEAKWFPEGSLADPPDFEADRAAHRTFARALVPGDAVAFHMLTLHSSAGSPTRRRVFSVRFVGDDARHAPRAWTTSPNFPGLTDHLAAGATIDGPLFPLAYQEATT